LVFEKGDLVVVAEVRTRGKGSFEGALASVTRQKRIALFRAIDRLWIKHLVKRTEIQRVRVDVVAVHFDGDACRVEAIEGALTRNDV